jgi:hypothetical protein
MRRTQALSGDGGCSQRTAAASVDRHEFHDINRQAETAHDSPRYKGDRKKRIDRVIYGYGFIYGYVYLLA